jgi:hypothetical protein
VGGVPAYLTTVVVLAAVLGFFAWLAALVRRRGLAGLAVREAMAVVDEPFHVTAHEAHQVVRVQAERKVPLPSPEDKPGTVRLQRMSRQRAARRGRCGGTWRVRGRR